MCGDIENDVPLEQQVIERFRALADRHPDRSGVPPGEASHDYMECLFAALLRRCADDLEESGSALRLRDQAVVLARLSGILVGHLPPEMDNLHAAMDALLVGYGEVDGAVRGHEHQH